MIARVKVKKFGRHLGVLIPRRFASSRKITVGTLLDLEHVRVLKPKYRRYTLAELMTQFKPEHRHKEWNLGTAVGREIW